MAILDTQTCNRITWSSTRRVCSKLRTLSPSNANETTHQDFADSNPRSKPIQTTTNTFPPQNTSTAAPGSGKGAFSTKRYLWTISFYAQFFDVDTSEVLRRCQAAIFPRANFLDVLDGNPDLYGPFWIATTVVVILFLTGTISRWLAYRGETHYAYDFTLLSGTTLSCPTTILRTDPTLQVRPASSMATLASSQWLSGVRSNGLAARPPTSSNAGLSTAMQT